jgi:hypothetical protein
MKKFGIVISVVATSLACLLIFWGGASATSDLDEKDLAVDHISKIQHQNPDFKIHVKPISKSGKFVVGEEVSFEFKANKDAYVTLIEMGTSGKMHVLFPNKFNKNNKVRKGKTYRIPTKNSEYSFRVKGPEGVNYVKIIGTLKPTEILPKEAFTDADGPFSEFKDSSKAAKDLNVELKKQDKKGWTEAEAKFTILASLSSDQKENDELEPVADKETQNFDVKLWTDQKAYKVGEPVTFYFRSKQDCYLNLVNFGTSGQIKVIYPNRYQRENFVKAGELVEIPAKKDDEYRVNLEGPGGVERIEAVVTAHKLKLFPGSYEWDKHVYQPWEGKSDAVEKDIAVQLNDMPEDFYARAKTTFKVQP